MAQQTPIKTLDIYDSLSLASTDTNLPPYSAKAGPSDRHRDYHFHKGNGVSGKAKVRSPDGTQYSLDADIHRKKPSSISLHLGSSTKNPACGFLTFPNTHNDFQIHTRDASSSTFTKLTQARARIGYPYPNSYSFTLPSSGRKVVWTRNTKPGTQKVSYRLTEDGTETLIASLSIVSGQKHNALLRWHQTLGDEWDEMVVLLSFVGVLTRLHLKGKDPLDANGNRARWNGMWFMAILGTAGVAG